MCIFLHIVTTPRDITVQPAHLCRLSLQRLAGDDTDDHHERRDPVCVCVASALLARDDWFLVKRKSLTFELFSPHY